MPLTITALYAALATFWVIYLAWNVGNERRAHKVANGDGGVPSLNRAIRAHGNAVETVPLALILLALSENLGAPEWMIHALGIALLVGRVVHALHFLQDRQDLVYRTYGMMLTVAMMAFTALGLLGHALAALF